MLPKTSARRYFWLLAIPFAALLFPGFYARTEPALFGVPFFYWYQFGWLLVSSALTAFVYVRSR
jgi:hypothetical protein